MAAKLWVLALVAIGQSSAAEAAKYLTSVTSEVFQAQGTPRELAARANTCISQHLAAGTVDAQLIVNSDPDRGIIVARSAIEYPDFLMRWKVRSVFTFEAREGRFRIEQTNLERFNDMAGGWSPIGKWTGSGWKKAEAAFAASANVVARCVMSAPKQDDW